MEELKVEQLPTRCIVEDHGVTIIQAVPHEDDQVVAISWAFIPVIMEYLRLAITESSKASRKAEGI